MSSKKDKQTSTCTFIIARGRNVGKRCCDVNTYCKNKRHRMVINTNDLDVKMIPHIKMNDLLKRMECCSHYSAIGKHSINPSHSASHKQSVLPQSSSNILSAQLSPDVLLSTVKPPRHVLIPKLKKRMGLYIDTDITSQQCPYCHKVFAKKSNVKTHVKRNRCTMYTVIGSLERVRINT